MSDSANQWNARYARSEPCVPPPAQVLVEGAGWLPATGASAPVLTPAPPKNASLPLSDARPAALDLACGRAGNGQWLAERGFHVTAWDISEQVIDEIRHRQPRLIATAAVRDVSEQPPEAGSFDVIVVCRFLDRALCPFIARALRPSGILFYQTFTHGLSNPDYLLGSHELPRLFDTLELLEYHEPAPDDTGKAEARLVARQADHRVATTTR